jgi:hypothetical protein
MDLYMIIEDLVAEAKAGNKTIQLRNKLCKKIIEEHFNMTSAVDRNFNYLWYMYHRGTKQGNYKAFMLGFELNLLIALGQITEEERENIAKMCSSQDEDNLYIALLAIDNFRKQRIKQHGQWKPYGEDVSPEFREAISKYPVLIVRGEKLDKL